MILGERKWFISLIIFAIVLIGIFAVRVRPVLKKVQALSAEYKEKISEKEKLVSRPEGPPTRALIKSIHQANESLYNVYGEGIGTLNLIEPRLPPENTSRPSIYWLDILRRARTRLRAEARKSAVEIPAGLSFGDDMPDGDCVPKLLRRLRIVEEILPLAIKSRVKSVTDIQLGDEEIIESSGEPFLEKLPLSFSIAGNLESLVRFIHSLQETDSLYIIESISIRSENEILKVNLNLSKLYITENFTASPAEAVEAMEEEIPY
jgi:hypothetical protein